MRSTFVPLSQKLAITLSCAGLAWLALAAHAPRAHACGCFAPPDPSVPIVQSGERILFSMEDGLVTSHIQIQYSGEAEEFAWLVPLPAEPVLELSTDELFTQIITTTQPKYRLIREYKGFCTFDPARNTNLGGGDSSAPPAAPGSPESDGPLVLRDTVGPYDYAVLRADSKQPMLDWLNQEEFFVPAGTDEAVDPYIREGGFFLALKLRKGNSVGDLQPVVVKYRSEMPMIPIVLTSVAADPDMPILVWVLGQSRAIPRNYYHTHINDALIDWLNAGANYIDVVTRAVDEANRHQSFVTEYAGTSEIMRGVLDWDGRFGDLEQLAQITDPVGYVGYLQSNGYTTPGSGGPFFGFQFSSQMTSILERHLPVPAEILERGVAPGEFYISFEYYLTEYSIEYPDQYEVLYADFDPALLTAEIAERIVVPTRAAGQLFRDNPYMTRLFTTLSPDEMTRDPVFSFNPDLPEVSNIHEARLTYQCGAYSDDRGTTPARLVTEQGWLLRMPDGEDNYDWLGVTMPASESTEVLREEGAPEVVGDNHGNIDAAIEEYRGGGCSVAPGAGAGGLSSLLLVGLALGWMRRRRA